MEVQTIKKPRKTVKLYGKQFGTQQMSVKVPCSIHIQIPKKNRLLGDARGHSGYYTGFMQMEGDRNYRRESNAGSHTPVIIDTTMA